MRICTGCAASGGDLSRYGYVVLNSWDAPLLPALKAANPGLKALVYKNLSFTMSYSCSGGVDNRYLSAGVGYCDADRTTRSGSSPTRAARGSTRTTTSRPG